ncbi:MAG: 4Fe-4S dicluster domain-containing protein [Thermoprotei archaeon]
MTKYGLLIETDRCLGCGVCVFACKDEFEGNDYPPFSFAQPETTYGYNPQDYPEPATKLTVYIDSGHFWIKLDNVVKGKFPNVSSIYLPQPCMQCEDAPCVKASGETGSVYKRSDGIIIIDPIKSRGQKHIVESCPYHRIYWNAEKNIPQKCTFCAHLVDKGKAPKCVESCPVSAMTFGDLDDPNSYISYKIKTLGAKELKPEFGTKPKVYYTKLL